MALTGVAEWKELIAVSDEDGRAYVVNCGWGVEATSAYIPSAANWQRDVPAWLHDRRDEVLALLKAMQHIVDDSAVA